jgi:hypothetical protein
MLVRFKIGKMFFGISDKSLMWRWVNLVLNLAASKHHASSSNKNNQTYKGGEAEKLIKTCFIFV